MGWQLQRSVRSSRSYSIAQVTRCAWQQEDNFHFLQRTPHWQDVGPRQPLVQGRAQTLPLPTSWCTLYLSAMLKRMADCSLRRQMGHRSSGRRSDSSRWFEPCITHCSHWQWRSPKMCPISWVRVWNTGLPQQFILSVFSPVLSYTLYTPVQNGLNPQRFHLQYRAQTRYWTATTSKQRKMEMLKVQFPPWPLISCASHNISVAQFPRCQMEIIPPPFFCLYLGLCS